MKQLDFGEAFTRDPGKYALRACAPLGHLRYCTPAEQRRWHYLWKDYRMWQEDKRYG